MDEIASYFHNYKKRKALPQLQYGYSATIEEFYEECMEHSMIAKENVLAWHYMLMEYIKREDAIFFLRRYENGRKDNGRWNTRRSAITRFADGFRYVFVSNFEAHEIYNMAYKGVVPTSEEFAKLLNEHRYPMHYDNGQSKSCEEIDISAFPHVGSVRSGVLNESKWYLAHVHSVNGTEYIVNGSIANMISKEEINAIAPRGELGDWKVVDDYPIRQFEYCLTDREKAFVIAHFLRFIDPLNFFATPIKAMTSVERIDWKQNIGEYPLLVNYVEKKYEQKFGIECMAEFYEKTMTVPSAGELSQIGKTVIGIRYGQSVGQEKCGRGIEFKSKESDLKMDKSRLRNNIQTSSLKEEIPIILKPRDEVEFKKLLLERKKAKFKLTFYDGHVEEKEWNARMFTEESHVLNNIRSKTWWRAKNSNGLVKVEAFIV